MPVSVVWVNVLKNPRDCLLLTHRQKSYQVRALLRQFHPRNDHPRTDEISPRADEELKEVPLAPDLS